MRERPVWEAEIPTEELKAASYPKLVISGTWEDAPSCIGRTRVRR